MAGVPPPGPPAGTLINGAPASRITASMNTLSLLPILRNTTMRPNRNLLVGPRRILNEEAWLATQVGTLQAHPCTNCRKGNGPFTDCVLADGHFKEACTSCYYGRQGSRCSLRHEHQNAVAHLQAEAEDAPDIPGMAPANNFGGQIGDLAGLAVGIAQQGIGAIVIPAQGVPPAANVPRGGGTGGAKRIAPLLVGPVGIGLASAAAAAAILVALQGPGVFGRTNASRARAARGLSDADLEAHRIRLTAELARASAELDAVRGEQMDREALRDQHGEEVEEEEEDDEKEEEEEEDDEKEEEEEEDDEKEEEEGEEDDDEEEEEVAALPAKKPKHGKKIKKQKYTYIRVRRLESRAREDLGLLTWSTNR
ncbi:uncharacterized protein EAF01_002519 [Botrytis porri]|uniref:Uncharacterized protein n=1 Tax=Botrytis porri TaxID=87229 RepID=A0A4Z1L1W6_9HELO|nr:uncharacterized protein EAF01_002519 [Botrytis porri]KAF7911011.1 hypothetical protein EAF01_002519 [Botrytis porri]TGO90812.1 hypothetical protein BPOR_0050g00170 [Botrytis porri]